MSEHELTIQLSDRSVDLPASREAALRMASKAGFAGDECWDIATAVFEACVNAMIHGCADLGQACLTIRVRYGRFEAVISDSGSGFVCPRDAVVPGPEARRGRGVPLMKAFMDEVRVETDNGCKVTLVKQAASPE